MRNLYITSLILIGLTANNSFGQYCITGGPSSTSDSNIESVNLNGNSFAINYTGCSPAIVGVEDQTSQTADLSLGGMYTVNTAFGTCGGQYSSAGSVWIDFNANDVFEASELIGDWTGTPPSGVQPFGFNVPGGATIGTTRMRVIQQEGGILPLDPCASFTWGSVTDFSIEIVDAGGCLAPQYVQISDLTGTTAEVNWTDNGAVSWVVEYGPSGFLLGTGTQIPSAMNSASITGLTANTDYSVYVQSVCESGDSSFFNGPLNFDTYGTIDFMSVDTACPPSGFIDISTTGTGTALSDDGEIGVTLGFNFPYQGGTVTQITIGNNGGLIFNTLTGNLTTGGIIDNTTQDGIYPFWDDLDSEEGDVYYETIGTAPNQTFIVQWNQRPHFSGVIGQNVTFQIQMLEATGEIYFVYQDTEFGGSQSANDFGLSAGIGIAGPIQDIAVSNNDDTYLQAQTCAHFFYGCGGSMTSLGTIEVCRGDTINLADSLVGNAGGGVWIESLPSMTLNDPEVYSAGLIVSQVYEYYYLEGANGCVMQEVEVLGGASGEDSTLLACPGDFVDLFDGLGGTFETTGTWYDPLDNPIGSSTISLPDFPGLYNYDYVAGVGSCPGDTSTILVDLITDCPEWNVGENGNIFVSIYPNPVHDNLTIQNEGLGDFDLILYNLNGQVLLDQQNGLISNGKKTLDLSLYDSGFYILKVSNESGEKMFRVIKN